VAARVEPVPREGQYETILSSAELDAWLGKIASAPLVSIDTETTSREYMKAELVGIALSVKPREAAYIPLAHTVPGAPEQLSRDAVLAALRPFLEDPARSKVGHDLKYDAHVFARYGIRLRGMARDAMLESYVLNSVAVRHDLDAAARHYLGIDTIRYEDVAGRGAKQLTFDQVDLGIASAYAAENADVALRLHEHLWSELGKVESLKRLYLEIEQPLAPVLFAMERVGVLIDRDMLRVQSRELAGEMARIEARAHELAGGPFNLGSPKQLQEILYDVH